MTNKFRLPRKIKKKLRNNLWLYPADDKGNSLMAFPVSIEKGYKALKNGELRNLMYSTKKERKQEFTLLNKEIYVSDETLQSYINDIFHKDYRSSSYQVLIEAKGSKKAKVAYFEFINAYNQYLEDDSYGNICSMAVDNAKKLLREERNKGKVFNNKAKFKKKR